MSVVSTGLHQAHGGIGEVSFATMPSYFMDGSTLWALYAVLLEAGRGRPDLTGQVQPQAASAFPDLPPSP